MKQLRNRLKTDHAALFIHSEKYLTEMHIKNICKQMFSVCSEIMPGRFPASSHLDR